MNRFQNLYKEDLHTLSEPSSSNNICKQNKIILKLYKKKKNMLNYS